MRHAQVFCLAGHPAAMGAEDDVIQVVEREIGRRRVAAGRFFSGVVVPDIQPGGVECALAQGFIQGLLLYNWAAANVDEE